MPSAAMPVALALALLAGLPQASLAVRQNLQAANLDGHGGSTGGGNATVRSRGLRCCCTEPKPGPLRCLYVEPKSNGKCPVVHIGGRREQLHHFSHTNSAHLCKLRGDEKFEPLKRSQERSSCKVAQALDATVFPPEEYGHYAIRLAQAKVPSLGDLYMAIKEIEIVEAELKMDIERLGDRIFGFKIHGPFVGNTAQVKAYLRGFDLFLPSSAWDTVLDVASKTEHVLGKIFTLGLVSDNYAKTENTPAQINFQMGGRFRLNDDGGWEVIHASRHQYAKVSIESGGLINEIVNLVINKFGGMDEIFYDFVWPYIDLIVPSQLGYAFEQVPYSSGRFSHTLDISAKCPKVVGKGCPSQKLKLEVRNEAVLTAEMRPIFYTLYKEDFWEIPFFQDTFRNMVGLYDKGEKILAGAEVTADVHASLSGGGDLAVAVRPRVSAPIGALLSVLGSEVPVANFLPQEGATQVQGTLDVRDGVLKCDHLKIEPLVLPVGALEENFMQFSATLEDLEIQVEDAGGSEAFENHLFLSSPSPASLRVPGIEASVGWASGFTFEPKRRPRSDGSGESGLGSQLGGREQRDDEAPSEQKDDEAPPDDGDDVSVRLRPAAVRKFLEVFARELLEPPSERTADEREADGIVPKRWRRPHAEAVRPIDFGRLVDHAAADVQFAIHPMAMSELHGAGVKSQGELVDIRITGHAEADLSFSSGVWKSILQIDDPDWGYLHLVVGGTFGSGSKRKMPTKPGVALLSCGWLKIYRTTSSKHEEKPFHKEYLELKVDLLRSNPLDEWEEHCFSRDTCCAKVGERPGGFLNLERVDAYFCTSQKDLRNLHAALKLQDTRITSAGRKWPQACFAGRNGKEPYCMGNPDGTWFQWPLPLNQSTWFPGRRPPGEGEEVVSPRGEWARAVSVAASRR